MLKATIEKTEQVVVRAAADEHGSILQHRRRMRVTGFVE